MLNAEKMPRLVCGLTGKVDTRQIINNRVSYVPSFPQCPKNELSHFVSEFSSYYFDKTKFSLRESPHLTPNVAYAVLSHYTCTLNYYLIRKSNVSLLVCLLEI